MSKKMPKLPYETPYQLILTLGFKSVICTSWDDGDIADEDYNSFDLD